MRDRIRELVTRLPRPSGEARRHRFVAGVLCSATIAGSVPVIAALQADSISDVRGAPGTFWLSGEQQSQIVLAATRGESASLAIPIDSDGADLDVVDTGEVVLVHDRSTGEVTWIDAISGTVGDVAVEGEPPVDDRATLVPAGRDAWLVDPAGQVRRIVASADGAGAPTVEPAVSVGAFDQWVATNDGRLWLLDSPAGRLTTVDADQVSTNDGFAEAGSDLSLSAVGPDPVVLDRTAGRMRWPRISDSYALAGIENRGLLQEPSLNGTCAVVLTDDIAVCTDSNGPVASMNFGEPGTDTLGAQLFANTSNLLLVWPGRPEVVVGAWADSSFRVADRTDPSARRLQTRWSPDGLLVDDPGSGYAITADDSKLFVLHKFSTSTVVLSSDGFAAGAGVGPGGGSGAPGADSDSDLLTAEAELPNGDTGDNDPPTARDDEATTRIDRAKQIDVLANDTDPDKDPLVIESATMVDGNGSVEIIEGSTVVFTPDVVDPVKSSFTYVIADPDGQTDQATVTVTIVGELSNTDPIAVDDEVAAASGVDIEIDVLKNDSDAEGDPLSVTKVGEPRHGSVSVTDAGSLRYQSDPGYTGVDVFDYDIYDGYGGTGTASVQVTVTPASDDNQPPRAVADRITMVAGSTTIVDVLANDTDPDGDALRITSVATDATSRLTVVTLQDQQLSLTAPIEGDGLFTVTYQITDGTLGATGSLTVVVQEQTATNRPPIAVDDTFVVASVPKQLNLTNNDSDPDGDQLTITSLTALSDPARGSVRRLSASSVQFDPSAPVNVPTSVTFSYTISDASNRTDEGRVTVQLVPPTNSGPVARDDVVTIFAGETAVIPVLLNDTHPDGLPFSLSGTPTYSVGVATANSDGTITFEPPSTAVAAYSLSYTIEDVNGRTATARVVVSVIEKPKTTKPPVAINDQATATVGTTILIPVLANDVDPDGQAISIVAVTSPESGRGTASRNAAGDQVRFVAPSTTGFSSFTYQIEDSDGDKATATVVVQVVAPANVPPIARDDLLTMLVGTTDTIDVLANDVDPDGTIAGLQLTLSVVPTAGITPSVTAGNKISVRAGTTPGTYTLTYSIVDPGGAASAASVNVVVSLPPNTAPIAATDRTTTTPGRAVTIAVLANDSDAEGGLLLLDSVIQPAPGQGSASVSGNSVVFDPGPTFFGAETEFSYVVRDVAGLTAVGRVVVTVSGCELTSPSLSNDDKVAARNETIRFNVFENDVVRDGTWTVGTATGGTVIKGSNGNVTYIAPATAGSYSFDYTIDNGCGGRARARATINVNRPPKAFPDNKTVDAGSGNNIVDVLANDTDGDGKGELSVASVEFVESTPLGISVTPRVGGGGSRIAFTAPDTASTLTFRYVVTDGAATDSALVTVNVRSANEAPVAKPDSYDMTYGTSLVVNPLSNDEDPNGDTLILTDSTTVVSGTGVTYFWAPGSNSLTLIAGPCAAGVSTLTYFVTDGRNMGATGTITVTVTGAPAAAPVAFADATGPVLGGEPTSISNNFLVANDTDANEGCGDTKAVSDVRAGTGGSATLGAGAVLITPAADVSQMTFEYRIVDAAGNVSDWALVTVTVTPPPPPTTVPPPPTTVAVPPPPTP